MAIEATSGAGNGAGATDLIKESSTATFEADVLDASQQVPVIVDFWAPWCGPCRQLTPLLEKAVKDARGKVRLVKINVDDNQALATQMGIQSIPMVAAFVGGRPVDGFMGALPESQIKAFIERLGGPVGPSPADGLVEQGLVALEAEDFGAAAQAFGEALNEDPAHVTALAGLAKCYIAVGEPDRARETLDLVPPEGQNDPLVKSAQAELALTGEKVDSGEIAELKAAHEQNPADLKARYDLAVALAGAHAHEEAVEHLLAIVQKKRDWNEEAARKKLLELFEALGPTHELTVKARRRLSSILFS